MFTKTNKNEYIKPEVVLPKVPVAPSLLSPDLTIIGDLSSNGEVQIDGTFTGDIKVDTLILGATANVVGEVFANSVRIHGKITGQINAKSVSLAKTANVKGDILHEKLAIEHGARLEGHCRRTEPTDDKTEDENPITLLVKGSSTPAEYNQTVSEVEAQTAKPKWFEGALNGTLVLIGLTFFLYMFII